MKNLIKINLKYEPILHLKGIIRLCETLFYHFQKFIHQCSFDQKQFLQKIKIQVKKVKPNGPKTVIYKSPALTNIFQSQKVIH